MDRELDDARRSTMPPAPSSISFSDLPAELPHATRWVDDFAAGNSLPEPTRIDLNIVVDEVVSNIAKFAYPDGATKTIRLQLVLDDDVVEMVIEDDGVPFDPLSLPSPSVDAPLAGRNAGGLGIHLVRNLMDEVVYQRVADCNRLVVRKRLAAR